MKAMYRLAIALSVVLMLTGVSFAGGGFFVSLDVKPQSCPNPFNFEGKGVLPVAILGTDDLNVQEIDVSSILLADVVQPLRSSIEDVATANADSNRVPLCPCNEEGPDGISDLTLKFSTQEVADAIGNEVVRGDILPLLLTGNLLDGTPIEGSDCVIVVGSQDGLPIAAKVTMCHRGMKTISTGAQAVPAHLGHGDTLGACP